MSAFFDGFNKLVSIDERHLVRMELERLQSIAEEKQHLCPVEFLSHVSETLSLRDENSAYAHHVKGKKMTFIHLVEPYNSLMIGVLESYFDPDFYESRLDLIGDLKLAPAEIRALVMDVNGEKMTTGALINNRGGVFGEKLAKTNNVYILAEERLKREPHCDGGAFGNTEQVVAAPV